MLIQSISFMNSGVHARRFVMRRVDKNPSSEHARAVIKPAIGIINGDRQLVVKATAEIAVIHAARSSGKPLRGDHRRRKKSPQSRST